ncbi:MAG TPA: DUF5655 domain-containing protein [Gemmatimonadales bacterium]|nr:DUF5655 domain-containing protein [Gemmatimonadales bacterium]
MTRNPYSVHPGFLRMFKDAGDLKREAAEYLEAAPGYVDALFAGPRAALRPIYEEILQFGLGLGPDVKVSPGKTIIPFYRAHVFAQVKPTTQTRVDLGFCLKGVKPTGRLLSTGGEAKGDRITHRIGLGSVKEFGKEAKVWMRKAYELDI